MKVNLINIVNKFLTTSVFFPTFTFILKILQLIDNQIVISK